MAGIRVSIDDDYYRVHFPKQGEALMLKFVGDSYVKGNGPAGFETKSSTVLMVVLFCVVVGSSILFAYVVVHFLVCKTELGFCWLYFLL